ncbi:MAG: DNA polymerase III subunit alpha [Legionellaceae bacterium]
MSPLFVHLRLHSEYSLIDGLVRLKPLVKMASSYKMPAVALTDQSNLFGVIKFYKAAMAAGIKPIIGADIWLLNELAKNKPFRLTLLAKNQQGYKNIISLLSKAYLEGQYESRPQIDKAWLTHETTAGIIALSGAREGDIGHALLSENSILAEQLLTDWISLFPNSFYLELQRTGREKEEIYLQAALKLAEQFHIPIVATNDVRFLVKEDFDAHEARVAIHDGFTLIDPRRPQRYSQQQYLRTSEEMQVLFQDIPEAIENTVEIAKRCNVELQLDKSVLPVFPIPNEKTPSDYLCEVAEQGLKERLPYLINPLSLDFEVKSQPYFDRLKIELSVINEMGFAGYFLIVADFIQWAKANSIPVGPGRGSGAGSLTAYALKITDIEPIQYDLLFERFLNPERVSMPDFDIDFCMDGRDRVIDYVAERYGRESVSQIITFGSMAAKAVVRDVGRVLAQPYNFVDKIAKLIPFELGITLDKALAQEAELKARYENEEDVRFLIDLARKLEGVTRNAGKHAGGVVIAPSALTDFAPLYCEPGGQNLVTQFDKDDVESVGLVKFDFLGLRTLTIINWAIQTINQESQAKNEKPIDISLIDLNDTKTYQLLKSCATTAVFQLESRGMKDLIKRLQPDCFEEIIALVALFRPGPLQSGMVDDFINRKHGRAKVEYLHPDLEPILRPTYGIILYQEQVMQIAQVLANYTLGSADLLRRAMGKKKPEEMAKQREIFLKGALAKGVLEKIANTIFDLMEKFAGYGFNKSHSAAYALVSFQTAWLKTHYPAEFMAAVLSSDMDNTDKVVGFVEECKLMKLTILPPNVNHSCYRFTVTKQGAIEYGLGAIKGVGEAAILNIIEQRTDKGPYKDLFDFCQCVDLRKMNKRVLEALIRSGAMDELGPDRGALYATFPMALKYAEQYAKTLAVGQVDLFAAENQIVEPQPFNTDHPWADEERLLGEKETLGHYLSGHPLQRYENELVHITTIALSELKPTKKQMIIVAGIIVAVRTLLNKKGERIAFITLDDRSSRAEISIFSDLYNQYKDLITNDQIVIIEAEASKDDYTGNTRITAKQVMNMSQARNHYAEKLWLKINSSCVYSDFVPKLRDILSLFQQGKSSVWIEYHRPEASVNIHLGNNWKVWLCDELILRLKELFSEKDITIIYPKRK